MSNKDHACTEERFLNDVKDHSMEIIRDDGVHRHIKFSRNGSSVYRLDLITWPGRLCIDGDFGTYVFSRVSDMFDFLRTRPERPEGKKGLFINPSYWGEKLLSIGTNAGYKEFNIELFENAVRHHFDNYIAHELEEGDDDFEAEIWEKIEDQVLSRSRDGEHAACDAINSFNYKGIEFIDFFDGVDCKSYTFDYTWCLYAIVYGISKYDEAKATNKESS
ncbi:hypothetical protein [Nitrosomonas sp. Nm58]|uniref:hypothetical protein n=1 Tax=Nitrosomonas sp. Nm58 TaxID=200126 RepID=UPI000896DB26|nr:hypothetical protein [Nitrosomonas sp. Nm58]SDY37553.1 hypothetical protein SAMN05421754_10089 [Nitrosomonas sp. Nm58]